MKYKIRPGIVKAKICGSHYLIPTRKASEECPQILRLSLLTLASWELLEEDRKQDIYRVYEILTKQPADEVRQTVDRMLSDLCAKGFLIEAEDEEN